MKMKNGELWNAVNEFYEGIDDRDLNRSEVIDDLDDLLFRLSRKNIIETTVELLEARQTRMEIEATLRIKVSELDIEKDFYMVRKVA